MSAKIIEGGISCLLIKNPRRPTPHRVSDNKYHVALGHPSLTVYRIRRHLTPEFVALDGDFEYTYSAVASYSSYGRNANHHIKLSPGFGDQPEVHGDNEQDVYFIMPLRVDLS